MSAALHVDEIALIDHVRDQRWFGAKSRELVGATIIDVVPLRELDPRLHLVLAELRYPEGTHDLYQLLLGQEDELHDALADDSPAREIVHLIRSGARVGGAEGTVEFNAVPGFAALGRELQVGWRIENEQSNTSVVFDDELILKIFRRLEPGLNPELERAPDGFLARLYRLGEVTGALHATLGSEPSDPAFSAEEPSAESLGLLTATLDDELAAVFAGLPTDMEVLAPILGRGEEVRERLRGLSQLGSIGKLVRHHGDYHLGQVLWASGDWLVIDFEGEPARTLAERRRKRSPLRDVAGMLRSFAHAASAALILRGVAVPEDWESRARAEFLAGYSATVDDSLLPAGDEATTRLLAIFELEKAVYELRYELDNRPDWISIPIAGIVRLLET